MVIQKKKSIFAANYSKILNIERDKIMKYEAVKYNSREEALMALQRMIQRKKDWEKKVQEEFAMACKEAEVSD